MKIDIVIITNLNDCRFYSLIDSIYRYVSDDILKDCNFLVCYTGHFDVEVSHIDQKLCGYQHTVIQDEYNFAKNANKLASLGKGDYLLFLNDDVEFNQYQTIDTMLKVFEGDKMHNIGTVGLKLLYPDNTIQHFGQILAIDRDKNFKGVGHYMGHMPNTPTPNIVCVGNTFACCMVRRDDWVSVRGLDESFKRCFEDCVFNWRLLMQGKVNVCIGERSAIHYESQTRGQNDFCREDIDYMVEMFNNNRDSIIQNRDTLKRTMLTI